MLPFWWLVCSSIALHYNSNIYWSQLINLWIHCVWPKYSTNNICIVYYLSIHTLFLISVELEISSIYKPTGRPAQPFYLFVYLFIKCCQGEIYDHGMKWRWIYTRYKIQLENKKIIILFGGVNLNQIRNQNAEGGLGTPFNICTSAHRDAVS